MHRKAARMPPQRAMASAGANTQVLSGSANRLSHSALCFSALRKRFSGNAKEPFLGRRRAFSALSYRLFCGAVRAFLRHGKGSSAPENAPRALIRRSSRRQKEAESTVRQATCRLPVSISRFCFVNIFYCQYCINIHFRNTIRSYAKPPATPKNTVSRPA